MSSINIKTNRQRQYGPSHRARLLGCLSPTKWLLVLLLLIPQSPSASTNPRAVPKCAYASEMRWGFHGHRIIGYIAWHFLKSSAKQRIQQALNLPADAQSASAHFAQAMVYADQIRNQSKYRHTRFWHYTTIPPQKTYRAPDKQDLISMLKRLYDGLVQRAYYQNQVFDLKMLCHLISDAHQPLHIGTGLDRGGNQRQVSFFAKPCNLHALWDTEMLRTWGQGPRRAAAQIIANHTLGNQRLHHRFTEWANEVLPLRRALYQKLPHDSASSATYYRLHLPVIQQQLYVAGRRLAYLLNRIYGT